MTSSMPIPKRRPESSSYSSSSTSSSLSSPGTSSSLSAPGSAKGKDKVVDEPGTRMAPRRPSLLGSSLSKCEHTVVNLGHEDGPPRLVSCVKSSQGFDWNQELFLPSYAAYDSHDLEHKQEPVQEIILTDEEAAAMLPQ